MLSSQLSGVVLNQNRFQEANTRPTTTKAYQEFLLPANYVRGTNASERQIPPLSGFQIAIPVSDRNAVSLNYTVEQDVFGTGWITRASGTATLPAEEDDLVWFDIYFDAPIILTEDSFNDRWRFSIQGTSDGVYFTAPNPLVNVKAYGPDGTTPLTSGSDELSFLFRILALTADDGTDFLGNNYRSAVITQDSGGVSTGADSNPDTFWLSKPNPSKFAIESLYFDLSSDNQPTVIDSVIVDPITQGVYFSIYYTSEGDPEIDPDKWDAKLWTRVPLTYRMLKRETYVLPAPIVARYVKIEFSHLQAQYYQVGDFAQPIAYKKFPKWVLNYFLLRSATDNISASQRIGVVWDALDLAFNYYLDDLKQEPDQPVEINPAQVDTVTQFLKTRTDVSDQVDQTTLSKINLSLQPFRSNPAISVNYDYLLGSVVSAQAAQIIEYPIEDLTFSNVRFADVSTLNRQQVVFEQNYPVMFFYLVCRHKYRNVTANFSHDRAYFVGVREIAFTRERYTTAHDTSLYIEATNDQVNTEHNDFVMVDGVWTAT